MGTLDIWYAHLDEDELLQGIRSAAKGAKTKKQTKAAKRAEKGSQGRGGEGAHPGQPAGAVQAGRTGRRPVPDRQPAPDRGPAARPGGRPTGCPPSEVKRVIHDQFRAYQASLRDDRRQLLERFEIVDVARKVVGVGSVGTRAFIVLLQGRDRQDPLFLQVKEATASVLEDHLPKSRYTQPGERVVQGQRMMQAASDIFLGWTKGADGTATSTGASCAT